MRWITVGPADQPGTSIVLHPPATTPGVTDRTLLIADCVLRSLTLAGLGLLAVTQRLTLPVLVGPVLGGLIVASTSAGAALLFDAGGALWATGSMVAAPLG